MVKAGRWSETAIVGIGLDTPLGIDSNEVWQLILNGESAFRQIPSDLKLRNYKAATIQDIPYDLPASDRLSELAIRALRRTFDSAGLPIDDPNVVTVLGISYGDLLEGAPTDNCAPSDWRGRIRKSLGLVKNPIIVSTACSSSSDAIALGLMLLRSGRARTAVCGGIDVLTDTKRLGHSALGTLSSRDLRAFDVAHDGTLLGEGAAFLVLTSEKNHPRALGQLLGHGAANDASTMTAPDVKGVGASMAIRRAIVSAGIDSKDICCYCAHGSGTALNDQTECAAISLVFNELDRLRVFATKGNLGHSLGATGAIEAVALLMALRSGLASPLAGTTNVLPGMVSLVSTKAPVRLAGNIGATVTLGFGGYNTCLVLKA